MTDLFTALALVLVIEGLFLAAFPGKVREVLIVIDQMPQEALRIAGLFAAGLGVAIVWLLRG
jgi:uncharacterized protein YjeT (DUF2065 family)